MKTIRRNSKQFLWVMAQDFTAVYYSSHIIDGEASNKTEVLWEMKNWNCWALKEVEPNKKYRLEFVTCAYYEITILKSEAQVIEEYTALVGEISRLWSTTTPTHEIQELLRQAEIAKDNELAGRTK